MVYVDLQVAFRLRFKNLQAWHLTLVKHQLQLAFMEPLLMESKAQLLQASHRDVSRYRKGQTILQPLVHPFCFVNAT